MKKFVVLFRMDILTKSAQPGPEQMKTYMEQWTNWINDISSNGQLASGGNHLLPTGKLLKPGNEINDTPYVANNESVAGYIIILANNIDDAVNIGRKCPILQGQGTSVEIRETAAPY